MLIFPNEQTNSALAALASRQQEIREEEAELLVFASGSPDFDRDVTLIDDSGEVIRRFVTEGEWAVYITDPYGEIYAAFPNEKRPDVPEADEILSSLRHINAACPE